MDTKSKTLFWIFVVLVILSVSASYYRFMVLHDYLIAYEGECDPYSQVCFIGCENDECTSEYYYSQIEKYNPNIFEQCGEDITDCEKAYTCLPEDGDKCSITFCNPEVDGDACEELTEKDYIEAEIDSLEYSDIESDDEMGQDDGENAFEIEEPINDEAVENI